jgi:hypothetical protein
MMQQAQPKIAATRGRCHNRPFAELSYSQGWNNALYQLDRGDAEGDLVELNG